MQLMCELFKNMFENKTRFEGICYDKNADPNQSHKKPMQLIKQSQQNVDLTLEEISRIENLIQANPTDNSVYSKIGPEYYIVVVICFYSLSIVFLLIFNSKFKCVINKNTFRCIDNDTENDLYELQKEETKTTIELLFQNSTKLFTSIASPAHVQTINSRNSIDVRKKSTAPQLDTQSLLSYNDNEHATQHRIKQADGEEKTDQPHSISSLSTINENSHEFLTAFESVV
jgi:hypothetical protein